MNPVVRPLISVTTYRRWTFLLGGTALLVPYLLIYAGLLQIMGNADRGSPGELVDVAVMLLLYVAVSSAVAFIPAVRILSRTAAETLLGVDLPEETPEGLRSWRSRRRTAVWWLLHLGLGGGTGFAALLGLPVVIFLLESPFRTPDESRRYLGQELNLPAGWAVAAGLLLPPAAIYAGAAVGALLARIAPALLGPSPADRLAQLERRTEQLMERNRLARELHDSVGHALTVTTLQAGAAIRVLDTDPEFARRALSAIEEAGRTALEDLDHVLGVLRDDPGAKTPQRTLADLGALFDKTRSAGVEVHADIGPTDRVPPVVSREAYRIVQEGLTNALRHAGKVPVTVRLAVLPGRFELEMTNPGGEVAAARAGGGRGLRGIRERVTILGGRMSAGGEDGGWRVQVTIPMTTEQGKVSR